MFGYNTFSKGIRNFKYWRYKKALIYSLNSATAPKNSAAKIPIICTPNEIILYVDIHINKKIKYLIFK